MKRDTSPAGSNSSDDGADDDARKPGRKRSAAPASTRTAALSRIRQREFRELEQTVAQQKERIKALEMLITSASPASCGNCAVLLDRIFTLETMQFNNTIIAAATNGFPINTIPTSPFGTLLNQLPINSGGADSVMEDLFASASVTPENAGDSLINGWYDIQETRPKNAIELFGPLDTEFTRKAMKTLPSLKNCKYVDELMDLFLVQGRCSEPKTIRKYILKIVQVRYKLMDACSLVDRQAVIEIWEVFFKRNTKHHKFWNSIMSDSKKSSSPTPTVTSPSQPQVLENDQARLFKQTVQTIPSLQDQETDEMVDELCAIFWTTSLESEREGKMYRILELSDRIMRKCVTAEDRTKFVVAAEVARESNRRHMDQLLDHSLSEAKHMFADPTVTAPAIVATQNDDINCRVSQKSNRGRKKSSEIPASKRTAQNREAQRKFNEKKQAYVQGLEAKVAELLAALSNTNADTNVNSGNEGILSAEAKVIALENENLTLRQRITSLEMDHFSSPDSGPSSFLGVPVATSNACSSCSAAETKVHLYAGRIQALEMQVAGLQAECSNLKLMSEALAAEASTPQPLSNISPSNSAIFAGADSLLNPSNDFWSSLFDSSSSNVGAMATLSLSATEMFGAPVVEPTIHKLKSLTSLYNCIYVDRLFDLFVSQASQSSPKHIMLTFVRIMGYFFKVTDATQPSERQQTMKILAEFHENNKLHMVAHLSAAVPIYSLNISFMLVKDHLFTMGVSSAYPQGANANDLEQELPFILDSTQETPQLVAFRNLAMTIPALKGSQDTIDELFVMFWQRPSNIDPKKSFFRIVTTLKSLMDKCQSVDERAKLMVLIEIWRSLNKDNMDELVEVIQDLSLNA
ncbi:hypothetical protein HDU77_003046 [Chytriomyces hyalinus]|nr:hypothetical protein HDU77_003046 [Chytriomyces hyalinus]